MLEVKDIHVYYQHSHIIFGASLNVQKNEIVCLLGRNGAGKSTTLRSIIGLTPPSEGLIMYKEKDITKEPAYNRGKLMGYVPENRGLFPRLTVEENLKMAAIGANFKETTDFVYEYFPDLERYTKHKAGKLSGGEQQMLAVSRGLVGNKQLLLLDEATQGLAPKIRENLSDSLSMMKNRVSILLVEQNVRLALSIADRVYVMRDGHIVFHGNPEEVIDNKEIEKYLTVG